MLPDALRLGTVRLAVTNLEKSLAFYRDVVGLSTLRHLQEGSHAVVYLGAEDTDVIVLQLEPSAKPRGRHAGLYHVAVNFPSRLELARALRRILASGTSIEGASDHGTHDALYLRDPDGHGVELAWDHPRETWRSYETLLSTGPIPLDLEALLQLTKAEPVRTRAEGVHIGHVHLQVGDIPRALHFYVELLGFELLYNLGSAAFVSAGGYHHHLAVNNWQGQDAPPQPPDTIGLREWQILLPDAQSVEACRQRLENGGVGTQPAGDGDFLTADPWGIPLKVLLAGNFRLSGQS